VLDEAFPARPARLKPTTNGSGFERSRQQRSMPVISQRHKGFEGISVPDETRPIRLIRIHTR